MSFDSAYTWWQARGGETADITPPVFIFLWRACDALLQGPGLVFLLHLVLFWSGLALLADALPVRRVRSLALMLMVALTPVTWLLRGHVWTDVGLLSSLLFVTAALAQAQATQRRRWIAIALPPLLYAGAVRHNALPALLPFALWIGWLLARHRSRTHTVLIGLVVLVASAACTAFINAQVQRRIPLWPAAAEWDLAALSVASGEMLLPPFMIGPGLTVDELAGAFRYWSNVPMLQNTQHGMRDPFMREYTPQEKRELRDAWLGAIAAYPRAWLAQHRKQAVALLDVHDADWPHELIYVDDEIQYRDNPPVARNQTVLHRGLMYAAHRLSTTRLLAGWPYLLLGLIAIPAAWRRRGELAGSLALIALASAWLYLMAMILFVAAELRYLGWPCVASVLALAVMLWVRRGEERRA
ncbi:MAG: hypothetical protein LBQ20_01975 [Rhodanobacter sp.]|jgi:hypothetical protein|nr:hypothetical protein [Rhodanobacter sp.]